MNLTKDEKDVLIKIVDSELYAAKAKARANKTGPYAQYYQDQVKILSSILDQL